MCCQHHQNYFFACFNVNLVCSFQMKIPSSWSRASVWSRSRDDQWLSAASVSLGSTCPAPRSAKLTSQKSSSARSARMQNSPPESPPGNVWKSRTWTHSSEFQPHTICYHVKRDCETHTFCSILFSQFCTAIDLLLLLIWARCSHVNLITSEAKICTVTTKRKTLVISSRIPDGSQDLVWIWLRPYHGETILFCSISVEFLLVALSLCKVWPVAEANNTLPYFCF